MNFQSIGHSKKRVSFAADKWNALKKKLLPASLQERKKRLAQYRDVTLFVVSIGLVTIFEKRLQKWLTVDKSELNQLTSM